jgi:phage-related minor tail protein
MASETGELAFVATMRDEASKIAKQARQNLDAVGGDVKPIVAKVKADTADAKAGIAEVEKAFQGVPAVAAREGQEAADGFGSKLTSGISGLKGKVAGALGGLALGATLAEGLDIDAGTDKLAAELGATAKQAKAYGKLAGDLYAGAWGESVADVQSSIAAVKTSIKGLGTGDDLKAATIQAMDFATIFEVDISRAASVAGTAIKSGLAKNATEAFDLLTAASQRVPKDLREDVLDATEEYGQFFQTVGIKGPQAMALLANGAAKGQYGIDKTGDAIKEFTIRATDMSQSSKDAYKAIGLDARAMSDDILAGGDVAGRATQKIVKGLLSIKSPSKQANTAIALFGTPLEDIGVKDIPKFLDSLDASGKGLGRWKGSIDRAGATLNDNAKTNLTSFVRQVKMGFVNLLGGKVIPVVDDVAAKLATGFGPAVQKTADTVKSFVGFLREHENVAKALGITILALTVITAAHSAVLAVGAAGGLKAWLQGTKLISAATKVWAAVQWALNLAMSANPIMLIVIALIALVAAVVIAWKKNEAFRAAILKAWAAIKGFVLGAIRAIGRGLVAGWNAIKNATVKAVSATVGFVRKHWRLLLAIFLGPLGLILGFVISHWGRIKSTFSAGISNVKTTVSNGIDKVKSTFSTGLDKVVGFCRELPGKILGVLSGLGSLLTGIGKDIIGGLLGGFKDAWDDAADWLGGVGGKIKDLKGPPEKDAVLLVNAGQLIMGSLMDGLGSREGDLVKQLTGITGTIAATFRDPALGELANLANVTALRSLPSIRTSEVIVIRHEVTSPDGSVSDMTADQIADLIARDPKAATALEKALRPARRKATGNTLESSR